MRHRYTYLLPLIIASLVLLLPSAASASSSQEAMFQDHVLLLRNQSRLPQTLETLRALGVQRLRISVTCYSLAPRSNSWSRPRNFRATDPASYGGWGPYDRIVQEAAAYGMGVNFDVMGGAPLWASGRPPQSSMLHVWRPSASEFGQFVRAVGTRYSGGYKPRGASRPLPRMSFWSVWNEPNVGSSSLSPQTVGGIEVAPSIYRSLLGAAYGALGATGHGRDTILVGELASTGHADPGPSLGMRPLRFLRALYCVDSRYRPLRGRSASVRGCPASGSAASFRARNPALFQATGWSHHPYHLTTAPNVPSTGHYHDWVTYGDLPKLGRALDAAQRAYGSRRQLPIYVTEYGFNTNPPQRVNGVSLAAQAAYLNQAEYIAWANPRVRSVSQYLLRDEHSFDSGDVYSAFHSGLQFENGAPKPSFGAYRLPIYLPATTTRRGGTFNVWACVRPASQTGSPQFAQIQYQRGSSGAFVTVRQVPITNARGYVVARVGVPASGSIRVVWSSPSGQFVSSRVIPVTVR